MSSRSSNLFVNHLRSGFAHCRARRWTLAEADARRALEISRAQPLALRLLGLALAGGGHFDEACEVLDRAVQLVANDAETWNIYGATLASASRLAEAEIAFGKAISLQPRALVPHLNLARLLKGSNRLEQASDVYAGATQFRPDDPQLWELLLSVRRDLCDLPGCIDCHRQIARLRPHDTKAKSQLLTALLHDDRCTPVQLYETALEQGRAITATVSLEKRSEATGLEVAETIPSPARPPAVHQGSIRRLRVGYLGACFRQYPVARFVAPWLIAHDQSVLDVVLYSDVPRKLEDKVTQTFSQMGFSWSSLAELTDQDAAQVITQDDLDVLIDLSCHMDSGRMAVLARRPAPQQVNYLSWPATTGLEAVAYRITDSHADPVGATEHLHSERLMRIDPCCWAYDPSFGTGAPLPTRVVSPGNGRGPVTFAAFNRLVKVTPSFLNLWRQILEQTPGSRLVTIAGAKGAESAARGRFIQAGFSADRIEVLSPMSRPQFLHQLGQCDLLLDTYPYNGMTTTCDALFMGVPVVTLAGASHVSRVGVSLLNAVGCNALVAFDEVSYVGLAVELANDRNRLDGLKASLVERTRSSPLADGVRLARSLESLLLNLPTGKDHHDEFPRRFHSV